MEIPLSKGRAFAIIDEDDAEKVLKHTWSLGHHGYAVKNRAGEKPLYMHRLIMDGKQIDHISRNKLDNRKCNLRETNHSLNSQNSGPRKGRYKGVAWDKNRNKWIVSIMVKGRVYNLGRFKKEEDAAKAYDRKAKELCGNPYLNLA